MKILPRVAAVMLGFCVISVFAFLSNGLSTSLVSLSTLKRHKQINPTIIINSYNLSVHCFTGWKGNFKSTQLYGRGHRLIISWNCRCFDSVGCLNLFSSSYTRSYGHFNNIMDTYFCSLMWKDGLLDSLCEIIQILWWAFDTFIANIFSSLLI